MSLIPRAEGPAREKPRNAAMRKPKAPEASRAGIVAAAIDEFAARGFKGAAMDAIAARTHTTRALINYYFGSKEKLYIAVLEQVYAEIREAEARLDLDHLGPEDAVRRIVEFTYGYYLAHEGFVRLVVAAADEMYCLRVSRKSLRSAGGGSADTAFRKLRARSVRTSGRTAAASCCRAATPVGWVVGAGCVAADCISNTTASPSVVIGGVS